MAAMTRSSSMSLSSVSRLGSIATFFTWKRQVIVTFTRPAPDCPSTSVFASSSCAFFMFSCICCACFISWPSPPFGIIASPLLVGSARGIVRRANGGCDYLGAEIAHEVAHEGIVLDRLGRARLLLREVARLRGGEARATGRSDAHREPRVRAEMLLELGLELFLVRLLRVHAMRLGHDDLEVAVRERSELA